MTLPQALQLQTYGETMNVKVDIREVGVGYAVLFHRIRTDNFNRAAMQLKHYEATAFAENHIHLIG